jgi:hypothetical protein
VLHPALESTFGVICYQEQMMHIMRDIGEDVGAGRATARVAPWVRKTPCKAEVV